jgi:hypothetical protein
MQAGLFQRADKGIPGNSLDVVWSKVKVLMWTLIWEFGIIEKQHHCFIPTDFTILVGVWNMPKVLKVVNDIILQFNRQTIVPWRATVRAN